jgi:rod shape determining protein RodA
MTHLDNNDITVEKGRVDWATVIIYLIFITLGWLNIYAASFDLESRTELFDLSGRAGMQLVWMGTALILAFILIKIDVVFYETYALVFYLLGIALLILTLFVASNVRGSESFLDIGPIRIQPAEFMKFLIALALAKVFNTYGFNLMERKNLLLVSGLILLPLVIVILQKETGTALVYLAFIFVLYREGLPGGILFMGFAAIVYFVLGIKYSEVQWGMFSEGEVMVMVLIIIFTAGMVFSYMKRKSVSAFILVAAGSIFFGAFVLSKFKLEIDWGLTALIALSIVALYLIYLFIRFRKRTYLYIFLFTVGSFVFLESVEYAFEEILEPHQKIRIEVLLGMKDDLRGAGYHVHQSKIAIGSGGLLGKGFLSGTQTKLNYIPDQDTDFIFCTIGEEHGFVGSTAVVLLFVIFILRLLYIAERQTSVFGRVYGYGVVSIFIFHLIINVGMVIGIMPVIGIPLPFFSYGGSSLWSFTIMLFILLRIDKMRKRKALD